MKTGMLAVVISFVIASPVHAVPLTWVFAGTTGSSSQFNGMAIGGLDFDLRIFLDTDLVGTKFGALADVFFEGPHQGEVTIETLGVLPVNAFTNVQHFAPGGLVTGVQYIQPLLGFSDILFASPISSDSLHLGPIAPTSPTPANANIIFAGPNGLIVFGQVTTFSAVASVPEAGSAALLVTSGLIMIGVLRRMGRRH